MTGRSVEEWIGKTPDEPVPPRVRIRVFDRAGGKCQCCTRKIRAGERWVADHIVALVNGGENSERNLQLLCDWCDRKVKTPADVAEKKIVARKRAKHLGIDKPKSRGFDKRWRKKMDGSVERRT
jgi:5-methylcytosine-specific restriction endonuclease McrA